MKQKEPRLHPSPPLLSSFQVLDLPMRGSGRERSLHLFSPRRDERELETDEKEKERIEQATFPPPCCASCGCTLLLQLAIPPTRGS